MNLHEMKFARAEIICIALGVLLLVFAALRETVMAMNP
jgi:hypothetical protein